jgi:hypothetical protein
VFVPEAGAILDSEAWLPELSPDGFIGLYFRWHEGMMHESRLCLYVVCQSYLPRACLEFADMVHRLEDACTGGCVSLSEEAQWLRAACSRNRARLTAEVCQRMGIRVPLMEDYCAAPYPAHWEEEAVSVGGGGSHLARRGLMALVSTETLHHDLRFISPSLLTTGALPSASAYGSSYYASGGAAGGGAGQRSDSSSSAAEGSLRRGGVVRLLNFCAETGGAINGSVCTMAPWDSIWVFQGGAAHRGEEGDVFGQPRSGLRHVMLPTATPRVGSRLLAGRRVGGCCVNFTAAEPSACKMLQVWCDEDEDAEEDDAEEEEETEGEEKAADLSQEDEAEEEVEEEEEEEEAPDAARTRNRSENKDTSGGRAVGGEEGQSFSDALRCLRMRRVLSPSTVTHTHTGDHNNTPTPSSTRPLCGPGVSSGRSSRSHEQQDSASSSTTTVTAGAAPVDKNHSLEGDVLYAYRKTLAMQATLSAVLSPQAQPLHQYGGIGSRGQEEPQQHYLIFDEAVLARMAAQGWMRDEGVAKLIPLGVGLYEHWQSRRQTETW